MLKTHYQFFFKGESWITSSHELRNVFLFPKMEMGFMTWLRTDRVFPWKLDKRRSSLHATLIPRKCSRLLERTPEKKKSAIL